MICWVSLYLSGPYSNSTHLSAAVVLPLGQRDQSDHQVVSPSSQESGLGNGHKYNQSKRSLFVWFPPPAMPEHWYLRRQGTRGKKRLFLGAANLLCQFHELINDWRRLNCIRRNWDQPVLRPCSINLCSKGGQAGCRGQLIINYMGWCQLRQGFPVTVGPGGEGDDPASGCWSHWGQGSFRGNTDPWPYGDWETHFQHILSGRLFFVF